MFLFLPQIMYIGAIHLNLNTYIIKHDTYFVAKNKSCANLRHLKKTYNFIFMSSIVTSVTEKVHSLTL